MQFSNMGDLYIKTSDESLVNFANYSFLAYLSSRVDYFAKPILRYIIILCILYYFISLFQRIPEIHRLWPLSIQSYNDSVVWWTIRRSVVLDPRGDYWSCRFEAKNPKCRFNITKVFLRINIHSFYDFYRSREEITYSF